MRGLARDEQLVKLFPRGRFLHRSDLRPADRQALIRRIRKGSPLFVRISRGIYALSRDLARLTPRLRYIWLIRTYTRIHPQTVFAGVSALVLHGWSEDYLSHRILTRLCVAQHARTHSNSSDMVDRVVVDSDEFCVRSGKRCTSIYRALLDCGRTLAATDAQALFDYGLKTKLFDIQHFKDYLFRMKGLKGIARVYTLLAHADGRSENGGESKARVCLISAGAARPELQVAFPAPSKGSHRFWRVDFLWQSAQGVTVLELDGMGKYEGKQSARVLQHDQARTADLHNGGVNWLFRMTFEKLMRIRELPEYLARNHVPLMQWPTHLVPNLVACRPYVKRAKIR